jgi:hypothetical protein
MLTSIQTGYSQSVVDGAMMKQAYRGGTKSCWSIVLSQGTFLKGGRRNFAGYQGAPRLAALQNSEQN